MGLRKILRAVRLAEDRVRQIVPIHDSEQTRMRDAQQFWSQPLDPGQASWCHTRDSDLFQGQGDANWLAIGNRHVRMFTEAARSIELPMPARKIVEWGCGGGANAVAFAGQCDEFWGVDVSDDVLDRCKAQVNALQPTCAFHSVRIDIPEPERALECLPSDVDVFYAMYVFELLPSQAYCERILKIAKQVLRPGGVAYIQIKYSTSDWRTRARHWGYRRGVANMCTFGIDEFWQLTEKCGFEPKSVQLVPRPTEVPDERYAYYLLVA
jgi:cyclopropane fatty-acyl-phospholipid synthase-like methyltransferase